MSNNHLSTLALNEQYGSNRKATLAKSPWFYVLLKKFEKPRLQAVADLLPVNANSIIDIGCNEGDFFLQITRKLKRAVGVDVVKAALQKAKKKKYMFPVQFFHADYSKEHMPFQKHSFDAVVAISTLQYVQDIDALLAEIKKVLKPGGTIIVEVPNVAVFWRRIKLLFGRLPKTSLFLNGWDGGVLRYFTVHDGVEYFKKNGFEVIRITCGGVFWQLRQLWPDLLGANIIFVLRKSEQQ